MPQIQTVREEHSAHTCYKIPGIVSEPLWAQTADTHIPRSPTKETDSDAARLLNWNNGAAGQWWAGPGAGRQPGYLQSDLGQVVISASSVHLHSKGTSLFIPPTEELRIRTLCSTPAFPKRGCQSCKVISLGPHAYYWTGNVWKMCGEPVHISQRHVLLPLAPNTAKTGLKFRRSWFLSCTEMQRHLLREIQALQGSITLVRSSMILSRNKIMTGKE